jgi:Ala-tRNA(Pro) deacylase
VLFRSMARLADEQTMAKLFEGCEVGAEPPIGDLFGMPTIVDDSLSTEEEVTFQAGTHQDAVKMNFGDYIRITRPRVAHFANTKKMVEDWEEMI